MKKKLYFDNTWDLKGLSIEIKNGKIRKYYGGNFTPAILFGGSVPLKTFKIESDFTLEKIHRYDRQNSGIHANYRIECPELFQKLLKPCYIRLNPIEKFIIDNSKNETVFHEIKFKQLIVIGLFVTLPIGLLMVYLSNKNILQKNSPNPNLIITNQDSINDIQKATTTSTKNIKLDRDTLSRN